jgi:hypothetical protein
MHPPRLVWEPYSNHDQQPDAGSLVAGTSDTVGMPVPERGKVL